jgi:hypothetical protein
MSARVTVGSSELYESLIQEVCGLERDAVIERLSRFPGDLRLDFSLDYLHSCDTERLRHLLLAAMWRCRIKQNGTLAEA